MSKQIELIFNRIHSILKQLDDITNKVKDDHAWITRSIDMLKECDALLAKCYLLKPNFLDKRKIDNWHKDITELIRRIDKFRWVHGY